tara:strand:- start:716 stop:931 length:216 start_codon:yes stop_codon:yes gene_type:complete
MIKPSMLHYNYLFHYNEHRGVWSAFTRDQKDAYFNGELNESNGLIYSDKIELVVEAVSVIESLSKELPGTD